MKPTTRSLALCGVVAAAAIVWPENSQWTVVLGVLAAIFVMDGYFVIRADSPRVNRSVAPILPVRQRVQVRLDVHNKSAGMMSFTLRDGAPESFRTDDSPAQMQLGPGEHMQWEYVAVPTVRGEAAFDRAHVRLNSKLGLWSSGRRVCQQEYVRIYPDYNAITQYLDLLADQHSRRLGLRRAQRRGEGLEFQQLREFRDGDSVRQVDWKATAKRRTLISKEYTEERDQSIVFLLDTGGRMQSQDDLLSHFDHALNSLLLLAYVALRQGDTVSLQTFGPTERWIGNLRGTAAVNRLLNELYDLHSQAGAGDYVSAAEQLMSRQRKRALVVVLSNLRQSDDDLLPAVRLLRTRHAVMVASLRERSVDEAMKQQRHSFEDALTVLGAHRYRERRRDLRAQLAASAQMVADCTPDQLPSQLVNGYWALKRAGVL